MLLAEPFDIEGVARHEMAQPLDRLRRADQPAGAAPRPPRLGSRTARLPQTGQWSGNWYGTASSGRGRARPRRSAGSRRRPAGRPPCRRCGYPCAAISSSLCSVARWHHDAADRDRLELGHRRQRAGAADLDRDLAQTRSAPARPGICARSPSAAPGRPSPAAPAGRAGRPCRRRRRCRRAARRARRRSRGSRRALVDAVAQRVASGLTVKAPVVEAAAATRRWVSARAARSASPQA